MRAPSDPVVGRNAELAAIDAFLADPSARVLLLEGEPGIGKTTLWLEALARAGDCGFRVLRAQPAESEATLSYAALTDLLGAAYDERGAELPEPQRRALEIALLRSAGRTDARTTASASLSLLAALAEREPVVVAVDDLQWLDRASGRALDFVVRRLPERVRLVLARRPGPDAPLGTTVAPAVRLDVGPLSLGALHQVLAARAGTAPNRRLLVRIAQTSGGNPFFALELTRALRDGAEPGQPLPVPDSLNELVAERLQSLSPAAREATLVCAALTRPTIRSVAAARGALEEAEAAGVLAVELGRIRFAHPLLASAVYASTHGTERLELHRRLAALVDDPDERARHVALSATPPDEDAAAELEAAADRAARRGAQDAAAELLEAAVRLTETGRPEARARRLRLEAAALHAAGSPDEARALAERAVEEAPPGPARAEALLQLSQIAWVVRGEVEPLDALRQALAEAGDDRALLGRIHAKLGMYSDSDWRRGVEHAEAAIPLLDEQSDPGLLAYTLLALLFFGAQTGRGIDERLLERALELERRAGPDSERSSLVLIWYQSVDDHRAARERHRLEDEWYRDRGEEIWRAEKRSHLATVEFQAGNWDLAEQLNDRSCAELDPVGRQGPLGLPFWTRAFFDAHRGRTDRARQQLQPLLADAKHRGAGSWFTSFHLQALGFTALTDGDLAGADRAFTEQDDLLESIGVTVPFAVRTDADHVEAVVGLGDLERAQRLVERFERRAAGAPRPWTSQALPRAQALLVAATGDVPGALELLEDGPVVPELPFGRARNLLVQGSLQRRLKRKRAAAESLRSALELFERLGSPDWAARARGELARVGLRRGDPDELTETERRVAELAATGLTNREVAQAAFVSAKTVEANLARVYRKLGIRSRAELGAAMASRQT